MNHPRFALIMIMLVGVSFIQDPIVSSVLFVLFTIELLIRFAIMVRKSHIAPYKGSLNSKIDTFLMVLDIVGILSLWITIMDIPIEAEDAALLRLMRVVYLLRTLRFFRFFDLQNVMYSPTYGMFISIVVMVSFFATGDLLWAVIGFFSVELILRFIIMRNMKHESNRERITESRRLH